MRRPISTRERARLFVLHGGTCHLCAGRIQAGDAWDVSHEIPLALGGADDDENRKLAHRKCHRAWTAEKDQPAIAKAKRREAIHLGFKRSGKPMPGSRASGLKKHMDGTVSRRDR